MRCSTILLASLLGLTLACASSDDDGGGGVSRTDARRSPDAASSPDGGGGGGVNPVDARPGGGSDGGGVAACGASPDYGEMGAMMGEVSGSATEGFLSLFVNANADPDQVSVELYDGYGAFTTGGIRAGTFMLTGAEADYEDCGACVLVYDELGEMYLASGGTLELTNVTDRITGTMMNVDLRHLAIDFATFSFIDAPDGCRTRVGRLSFDQPIPTM